MDCAITNAIVFVANVVVYPDTMTTAILRGTSANCICKTQKTMEMRHTRGENTETQHPPNAAGGAPQLAARTLGSTRKIQGQDGFNSGIRKVTASGGGVGTMRTFSGSPGGAEHSFCVPRTRQVYI